MNTNDNALSVPVLKNVRWGITWGISLAGVFSAYVCTLALIHRSVRFDAYGTTVWLVVLCYIASGVIGGLVLGILRPITTILAGAIITGIASAVPFFIAVWVASDGLPRHWKPGSVEGIVLFSVILGGGLGAWRWVKQSKRNLDSE